MTQRRRLLRTATCWTIQRKQMSSAAARASVSSTSTPTDTVQGDCSSSPVCGCVHMSTEVLNTPTAMTAPLAALKRVAIVPAYNEERNVGRVIDELHTLDPGLDVVVVSDGSNDRTVEVAAARGAHVISLPFNLGIGGAVQTGFRYAWEERYELAVRLDGDGQHDPAELRALVAPVIAGEADLAVGSPFVAGGGYRSSAARRVGIRILARVVSWIARQRLTDTTSGFQAA